MAGNIADAAEGAAILAHENVLQRMTTPDGGETATPADAQPTDTYYTDTMKLSHFFNGEGVQLLHQPSAHSDGDSLVVLPRVGRDCRRRHLLDDQLPDDRHCSTAAPSTA